MNSTFLRYSFVYSKVKIFKRFILYTFCEEWTKRLEENNIESVDVSIREIQKYVAKNFKAEDQRSQFIQCCKERLMGHVFQNFYSCSFDVKIPLQYIIHEWDFRQLTLRMKSPVFIPRPETEGLVDLINNDLRSRWNISNNERITNTDNKDLIDNNKGSKLLRVLEVGCGTGAISLSLLHENREGVSCAALDILQEAVELTKWNAERLSLSNRLKVVHTSIDNFSLVKQNHSSFDMLVSNPPYIPTADIDELQQEVRCHESRLALDGGADGLDIVRRILYSGERLLRPLSSVWLEVNENHPEMIERMMGSERTFRNFRFVRSYKDYYDRPRFCHLRFMGWNSRRGE